MVLTRRQFVARMGTLTAALGLGEASTDLIASAFAHGGPWAGGDFRHKPKVIWVHGAECTGCSVSLLGLFEDVTSEAYPGGVDSLAALSLAVGGDGSASYVLDADPYGDGTHPFGHRTLYNSKAITGSDFDGDMAGGPTCANIADVLIDFIDVQYHETIMGMGGDLAYQWLKDNLSDVLGENGSQSLFVLVVEGAVQPSSGGGYWNVTGDAPWCAIGADGSESATYPHPDEHEFDEIVLNLSNQPNCKAVIAVGQCATFGGIPASVSPVLGQNITGAKGVYDYLWDLDKKDSADKVINVPGCPANPWWIVLTIVLWLVDATNGPGAEVPTSGPLGILDADWGIQVGALDTDRRLRAVYDYDVHGAECPKFEDYKDNIYATYPGDDGCLYLLGCEGHWTSSMCNIRGWNGQQPNNPESWDEGVAANLYVLPDGTKAGGCCIAAGSPCKGCTENGYPDDAMPFVNI